MHTLTKALETGNHVIDTQHRTWIENLNKVLEDCKEGNARKNMQSNLLFLRDYTAKHFNDEEQLQQQYKYPDYITHKQYHNAFKKVLDNILEEFNRTGPSIVLTGRINRELGDWFMNHIQREDFKLVAHIKKTASQ